MENVAMKALAGPIYVFSGENAKNVCKDTYLNTSQSWLPLSNCWDSGSSRGALISRLGETERGLLSSATWSGCPISMGGCSNDRSVIRRNFQIRLPRHLDPPPGSRLVTRVALVFGSTSVPVLYHYQFL